MNGLPHTAGAAASAGRAAHNTLAPAQHIAASDTGSAAQAFAQVWSQQAPAAWLSDSAAAQLPVGDAQQVHIQSVEWSDVLPALHLPPQAPPLQQATDVLGVVEGEEVLEQDAMPAMQPALLALPVVHPQLRREAVQTVDVVGAASASAGLEQGARAAALAAFTAAPSQDLAEAGQAAQLMVKNQGTPLSPLAQTLAQRIQVQQVQGQDVVTVRLDPPHLGKLEIRIQQDATGVQVHLQASHAEVGRQLTSVADSLRQELQARTVGEALVTVSSSQRSMAGQGQGERQAASEHEAQHDEPVGQALQFELSDDAV